ncbi:hypothetical protein DAPPUDRAFT_244152 [Daphnia pulex]|uniref:Uncharacterized protein n=1 Tax=Daphnia pulex TaxID=6669 RepID=E9GKB7_DAPPU|nr:hypothetical protein DAPPUDRAFT_244152 [Daphnia pulex]|eukprot:EFX79959.1 hypothetical protein DAPPUDRAFT_244152 [Daphnia pulex]
MKQPRSLPKKSPCFFRVNLSCGPLGWKVDDGPWNKYICIIQFATTLTSFVLFWWFNKERERDTLPPPLPDYSPPQTEDT